MRLHEESNKKTNDNFVYTPLVNHIWSHGKINVHDNHENDNE